MRFQLNIETLNMVIRSDYGVCAAVLLGGALGGVASTLIGPGFNAGEAEITGWAAAFLGTLAGGIGVYVLANCNTRQVARTVFFAVVCGYCGQFIFQSAEKQIAGLINADKQEKAVDQNKADIESATKEEGTAGIKAATRDAEGPALELVSTAALATSSDKPEIAKSATVSLIALVDSAARAAEKEPDSTITLIESIGKRADARGVTEVKVAAQQAVEAILQDASIGDKPAVAQRAKAAARALGATIPDAATSVVARAPRVHFEVPPKTTDATLAPLKTFLSADRYNWRSTGYIGNLDTNELKVIYYDPEDKAAADKLIGDLKSVSKTPDAFINATTILGRKPAGFTAGHMDLRVGKTFVAALEEDPAALLRNLPEAKVGTESALPASSNIK